MMIAGIRRGVGQVVRRRASAVVAIKSVRNEVWRGITGVVTVRGWREERGGQTELSSGRWMVECSRRWMSVAGSSGEEKKGEKELVANKDGDEEKPKPVTIMDKMKKELMHYWTGTKLLGTEIKISARLLAKSMSGKKLSRRERRQLKRTTGDLTRLVPFIVILLVPFMELALPVIVKLFPNFLPSTFHTEDNIQLKKLNLQKTRLEAAKLLKAAELERERGESIVKANFLTHLETKAAVLSGDEIIEIAKLFPNHITIQELPRWQLIGICRYLDVVAFGPTSLLKALIIRRLNYLIADDHTIHSESTASYTLNELKQICSSRGLRVYSKTEEQLKKQLDVWLTLTVEKKVPNGLLILSNAAELVDDISSPDLSNIEYKLAFVLRTIYNLPEKVILEAKMAFKEAQGTATVEERLSFIQNQEIEIEKELSERDIEQDKKSDKPA